MLYQLSYLGEAAGPMLHRAPAIGSAFGPAPARGRIPPEPGATRGRRRRRHAFLGSRNAPVQMLPGSERRRRRRRPPDATAGAASCGSRRFAPARTRPPRPAEDAASGGHDRPLAGQDGRGRRTRERAATPRSRRTRAGFPGPAFRCVGRRGRPRSARKSPGRWTTSVGVGVACAHHAGQRQRIDDLAAQNAQRIVVETEEGRVAQHQVRKDERYQKP